MDESVAVQIHGTSSGDGFGSRQRCQVNFQLYMSALDVVVVSAGESKREPFSLESDVYFSVNTKAIKELSLY